MPQVAAPARGDARRQGSPVIAEQITYTLGGLLHILLVIAVVLLLVRVIQGRAI